MIDQCQNCLDWARFNHFVDAHLEMELEDVGKISMHVSDKRLERETRSAAYKANFKRR